MKTSKSNQSHTIYHDVPCRYFESPGQQNTHMVMEMVAIRAKALSIKKILVASNTGKTAFLAFDILGPEYFITAVTHVTGFQKPDHQELSDEMRKELEIRGVRILTCQHAFGGVNRAIRNQLGTMQVDEIMANTLRLFGQGTKVAIELALMAADAGHVRTDEDIIAVGGTGSGADTALVLRPANSFKFFDLKIREIICKPDLRPTSESNGYIS